ncbi:MAG: mechanosensitive ion channel family protein [Myxococcota bacterium]|nr:mechanosensitive ion channel family protein [Myxococcota bacterium]
MRMPQPIFRTFVFLLTLLAGMQFGVSAGFAAPAESCESPYSAIKTLLDWLQPENYDPSKAALCLDLSAEADAEVGSVRARQIIEVLDGRGLFIQLDAVPTKSDYADASGRSRYVLSPKEADIFVERVGDRWLWSKTTVARIPALHRSVFLIDTKGFVNQLPSWMQGSLLGIAVWQLVSLFGLILVALLLRMVVRVVFRGQIRLMMKRLSVSWEDSLIEQVGSPVGTFVASGIAMYALPLLLLPVKLNQFALLIFRVVCAVAAVVMLYRLVDLFTAWLEQKAQQTETKLDDQLVPLARRALKIFIVSIGTVFVLQNLNYDVASLIAGLGIGGLAFALAAKDTIANLFGSATIFASRPFQIGDWVVIGGSTEGVVESVGFRSTRVRTFYNSLISIPNAKVADAVVDNYGAREFRRFKMTIGLTYDTTTEQMQAYVEGVRAILKNNPSIRQDAFEVHFNSFGDSSLNVLVYSFLKVPDWSTELREKHNLMLEFMRLADKVGVSFAFPTQTLHLDTVASATDQRVSAAPTDEVLAELVESFGPEGANARPAGPKLTHGFFPGS